MPSVFFKKPYLCRVSPINPAKGSLIIFIIWVLFALPFLLEAKEPDSARTPDMLAYFNRSAVHVGEIVELTLAYTLSPNAIISDPPQIKGLDGLTVINVKKHPDQINLSILVNRLGSWKTKEITLIYNNEQGQSQTLFTAPVSLKIMSNLGEKPAEAHLKPIQDIINTSSGWIKHWPWLLGLGGLIMAIVLLFCYIRGNKQKGLKEEYLPPYIQAEKELNHLETQGLFEKGQVKAYYFRFSEILRRYLEALRGFPAAEMTTEEIVVHTVKQEDQSLLRLLKHADLVKFADTSPTPARKEGEMQEARAYINGTKPDQGQEDSAEKSRRDLHEL